MTIARNKRILEYTASSPFFGQTMRNIGKLNEHMVSTDRYYDKLVGTWAPILHLDLLYILVTLVFNLYCLFMMRWRPYCPSNTMMIIDQNHGSLHLVRKFIDECLHRHHFSVTDACWKNASYGIRETFFAKFWKFSAPAVTMLSVAIMPCRR